MSKREQWRPILDVEVRKWSAMPYQQLIVELSSDLPDESDFDLMLYPPDTVNFASAQPVMSSTSSNSTEFFRFVAPDTGDYYLDVSDFYGSGAYNDGRYLSFPDAPPPEGPPPRGASHGTRMSANSRGVADLPVCPGYQLR